MRTCLLYTSAEYWPEVRGVRVDSEIKVTYDMPIALTDDPQIIMKYFDPDTQNWEEMTITPSINGNVLTIIPAGLDFGTDYQVRILPNTVKSAETGLPSTLHLAWHFTTGMAMDIEPQEIYVRSFEGGGEAPENVEFNQTFTLTLNYGDFNEELSCSDFALGGIFADWDDKDLAIISAERDLEDTRRVHVCLLYTSRFPRRRRFFMP